MPNPSSGTKRHHVSHEKQESRDDMRHQELTRRGSRSWATASKDDMVEEALSRTHVYLLCRDCLCTPSSLLSR